MKKLYSEKGSQPQGLMIIIEDVNCARTVEQLEKKLMNSDVSHNKYQKYQQQFNELLK